MDSDFATGYALGSDSGSNNNGGCGGMWGGEWIWAFLIIALIFGGNGCGFGGFGGGGGGGALTRADLSGGFTLNNIERQIQGVQTGLCDGFYGVNTSLLTGFNGVTQAIADSKFAAQQCCCETGRAIDGVKYAAAENTCAITNAIHAEGEATRALINANTMQDLRDKLESKDRDLIAANFQLSQLSQTANIVNTLRPTPVPAYITCSPYQALAGYGNGCGSAYSGCGCC